MIGEVKTIGNPFTFFKDGNLTTRTIVKEERKRKEVEKAEQGYHQFKRKLQAPNSCVLYTVDELIKIFNCPSNQTYKLAKELGRTIAAINRARTYFNRYCEIGEVALDDTWRNETFISAAERVIKKK